MEGTLLNGSFWQERSVLITGHTGFKGSWLSLMLTSMGARVQGFGFAPPTDPSLFEQARITDDLPTIDGDVAVSAEIVEAIAETEPDVVFHLAAQSLVRRSYEEPLETFRTNVLGTASLLDALYRVPGTKVAIVATSDKCYENLGDGRAYDETSPLGGHDPYSSSKAAAEHVAASMRDAFFAGDDSTRIATVRGGNVIGACDWAQDRLIPDLVRAEKTGAPAPIRNPEAIRPWQHVLDCLSGYISLAEELWQDGTAAGPWNFGPWEEKPVRWIADHVAELLPGVTWEHDRRSHVAEATVLKLDSSKARERLGWGPRVPLDEALRWTIAGYRCADDASALRDELLGQFEEFRSRGPRV